MERSLLLRWSPVDPDAADIRNSDGKTGAPTVFLLHSAVRPPPPSEYYISDH